MRLDHRAGGFALALGYGLLLAALFRDPASGLATVTGSFQALMLFGLLPTGGLASGAYVVLDWPYRAAVAFLAGSYLAFVGLAVVLLGTVVTIGFGLTLFALAVVALVAPLGDTARAWLPELDLEEPS